MTRFLHTSDWQLGMTRHFLEGEAQARYTAARIDVIREIGRVARDEGCEFVVVAGDVFESNLVASQTVRRALQAMASIEVPVYLLPGNHDPLDAVSLYRGRLFAEARPENVHVLDEPGPRRIAPGVELVAAPWSTKAPLSDLVGDALAGLPAPEDGGVRIVVGHGAVDVLTPDEDDIAALRLAGLERALADGLVHYVALGDKHTRLSVGRSDRVHYSGSPEVTSFREERPGDVLVVDVDADRCAATPHHVGTWRFVTLERPVDGPADIEALDAELGALDPKDRAVVRTGLSGTLSLADKARLDTLLDAYTDVLAARFTWPGHEDIAVYVAPDELTDLGVGGFVDGAVESLAHQADAEGGDATAARDALSLLYRLAKGPAA